MLQFVGILLIAISFFCMHFEGLLPVSVPVAILFFFGFMITLGAGSIMLWQGFFDVRERHVGQNGSLQIIGSLLIAIIGSLPAIYYLGSYFLDWLK